MDLRILTPDKAIHVESVTTLSVETTDGEIGILPGHIPLLTPVNISVLRYKSYQSSTHYTKVALMGGVLYTDGAVVTVLCESAEKAKDIDSIRAEHARQRAAMRLKQKNTDTSVDIKRAELALARSLTRLKASRSLASEKW